MTQNPKRILYIDTARSVGGSVVSLYHLLRRLDRTRFTPVVLSNRDHAYIPKLRSLDAEVIVLAGEMPATQATGHWSDGIRRTSLLSEMPGSGVGKWLYHLAGFWLKRFPALVQEALAVRRIIRANQIDLVHCNVRVGTDRAGILGSWLAGVPCVCHVRDYDRFYILDHLLARGVSRFIYISQAIARQHWAQGIPNRKGRVIYNGVELSQFQEPQDRTTIRRRLGLSVNDQVVGVVGRLEAWKGQHYFLQALAEASAQLPNCRGLVVGDAEPYSTEYREYLLSLAQELDLGDRVRFTGFQSNISEILAALDVLVSSSAVGEPFGRTIVEGMAAGVPVIATAAGAVPEIVEDGVTGLLVPPRDAKSLGQAIVSLLANGRDTEQMGRLARARVAERFTSQQTATAVQKVYGELLC